MKNVLNDHHNCSHLLSLCSASSIGIRMWEVLVHLVQQHHESLVLNPFCRLKNSAPEIIIYMWVENEMKIAGGRNHNSPQGVTV